MKKYCPICGSPTDYTGQEPDKCESCGKSFSAAFKITSSKKKRRPVVEEEYNDDDEDGDDHGVKLPNIKKLSISFIENVDPRVKLEDVVKEGPSGFGSRPVPEIEKANWLETRANRLNKTTVVNIGGNE